MNVVSRKAKVYFRNSMPAVEGIIQHWNSDSASLINLQGDVLIINNPSQDVMLIEIFAEKEKSNLSVEKDQDPVTSKDEALPIDMLERAKQLMQAKYVSPNFTKRVSLNGSQKKSH